MKKLSLLIAIVLVMTSMTHAQTTFGVRAGVNFQNINGKSEGKSLENKLKTGINLGINAEIGVAPDFYFQPGLLFTTKGAKIEGSGDVKVNLSYLEIPMNLVYKPVLGNGNLIAGFGPYMAYGIGGKWKSDAGDIDVKFGSGDDDDVKPFDMGANLLFGYEFASKLSVQMNAQLGLLNLMPKGDSDNSLKNTGFGISLGYRF